MAKTVEKYNYEVDVSEVLADGSKLAVGWFTSDGHTAKSLGEIGRAILW